VASRYVLFVLVFLVGEWCVSVWVTVISVMLSICCEEEGRASMCPRIYSEYMRTDFTGLVLRLQRPAPLGAATTFPR